MTGDVVVRALGAVAVVAVVAAGATGCGGGSVEPVTSAPWVEGGLPEYCAGRGGDDAEFWDRVHQSCQMAQDGDLLQARALRSVLREDDTAEVEAFHRTLVRLNHALRDASDVAGVADEICGASLGADLGADYRTWVVAHGQLVYEAVLEDPDRLRDFPDAQAGCGLGEPFGAVASTLYLQQTGITAADTDLPLLED